MLALFILLAVGIDNEDCFSKVSSLAVRVALGFLRREVIRVRSIYIVVT